MNISILLAAVLFFLLTPNILLRIPKNGNKYVVAGVHAIVFSLVLYLICLLLKNMNVMRDGFTDAECTMGNNEDGGDYMLGEDGKCNLVNSETNKPKNA